MLLKTGRLAPVENLDKVGYFYTIVVAFQSIETSCRWVYSLVNQFRLVLAEKDSDLLFARVGVVVLGGEDASFEESDTGFGVSPHRFIIVLLNGSLPIDLGTITFIFWRL